MCKEQTSVQTERNPRYRADIDGLRAIAVSSVVIYHAAPYRTGSGFIGVDIFFVISGFLISTIILSGLREGRFSFVEFYCRRIRRIFPSLLLVLCCSFWCGWLILLAGEYSKLGKHIAGAAGFIINFFLLKEGAYYDNWALKPLLHLWSLAVEEQFYILWSLFLWGAWKLRIHPMVAISAVALSSFCLGLYTVNDDISAAFYLPQTRIWELLAGALLAHLKLNRSSHMFSIPADGAMAVVSSDTSEGPRSLCADYARLQNSQAWLGALLIAWSFLSITEHDKFPGWLAAVPVFGTCLVISAGPCAWLNRVVLSHRALVWVGLISYPLYLWHWPILSFTQVLEGEMPDQPARFAAVISSVVLAWLTYRFIERPARSCRLPGATLILLAMMGAIGLVGYYCYSKDGRLGSKSSLEQRLVHDVYSRPDATKDRCFIETSQDHTSFSQCTPLPAEDKRPAIFIWGDSHADHLVAGYKKNFGAEYRIIPRTAAKCPPIPNIEIPERPFCREINDYVFSVIRTEKPFKVVLAASWTWTGGHDWRKVKDTITALRRAGISNIDLVGPVPQWFHSLPRQLYRYFNRYGSFPERMDFGLSAKPPDLESLMSKFAEDLKVNYISAIKILCNDNGCITRFGDTAESLEAWDGAHLTETSSIYLVSKFPSPKEKDTQKN